MKTIKRITHKRIRELTADTKSKITDKELFTSTVFTAYLNGIAESAIQSFGRTTSVVTQWDESPGAFAAYTDNTEIVINVGNGITRSFRTRRRRADSIVGMNAHEIGHVLYTDFTLLTAYNDSLMAGKMYPNEPSGLSPEDKNSLAEIKDLLNAKDRAAIRIITRTADRISNILEDEYIESRMRSAFPGRFRTGIAMNNYRAVKLMPIVEKQIDDGYYGLSILMNMCIVYRIKRDMSIFGSYTGEYLDVFSDCVPHIDNSVYAGNAEVRYDAANNIIVKLWRYIKPLIDKARADEKALSETLEKIIDRILSEVAGQVVSIGGKPNGTGEAVGGNNDSGGSEPGDETDYTDAESSENNDDGDDSDIDSLLDEIANVRVCKTLESELTAELQSEADKINQSGAYLNVNIKVNRINPVNSNLIRQYNLISPPLLKLSKRLREQVYPVLKDKRDGGKMTGLYWGKHINPSQIHKNDGRIFCNKRLPEDNAEIAVALLIDESYSMME